MEIIELDPVCQRDGDAVIGEGFLAMTVSLPRRLPEADSRHNK